MLTVFFGSQRELRIRGFVDIFPFVSTSVVYRTFFAGMKSKEVGMRKARQVLQRMVQKKLLRRFKFNYEYHYHIEPKTDQWFHTYCVTKFHFDFACSLPGVDNIMFYKREYEYPDGRADALYVVRLGDGGIKFFLEYDDGRNEFDKIQKYEEYFRSGLWKHEHFADPLKNGRISFPAVLVVTERDIPGSEAIRVVQCKPGSRYLKELMSG